MKQDLGKRVIAFIIDSILVGMISSFLQVGYNFSFQVTMPFWDNFVPRSEDWWQSLVFVGYFVLFAIVKDGKTIGKMAMDLTIVDDQENPLERNQLILREVIKAILMPIAFISFIIAVIREDDKAIHDLIFESNVVEETAKSKSYHSTPNRQEKRRTDDDFYD